jgi:MFS family permease
MRMNPRTLRILQMFTLVVAGEMIFGLPYNIPRYFRPTLLEAFDFTNTQLGDVFAAYGVMAMLAYFPGGVLADRFSTRGLMTTSLIARRLVVCTWRHFQMPRRWLCFTRTGA